MSDPMTDLRYEEEAAADAASECTALTCNGDNISDTDGTGSIYMTLDKVFREVLSHEEYDNWLLVLRSLHNKGA